MNSRAGHKRTKCGGGGGRKSWKGADMDGEASVKATVQVE